MKKFTFMMIAAFMAVASFAGVPVRKAELAAPQQMTAVRTKVPTQKAMPSMPFVKTSAKKVKAAAKAPRKVSSTAELAGDYILASDYYEWDEEKESYVEATPSAGGTPVTIEAVDETTISITGFTYDATEAILATVNVEEGTISIAAGQKLLDSSYGTVVLAVDTEEEDAPLTGVIGEGFIAFEALWYPVLADGDYAGYMWTDYCLGSFIVPANGTMAWGEEEATVVPVYIEQSEDLKTVTVYNFGGWETAIDVTIKEEQAFVIEEQPMFYYNSDYGYYYFSGLLISNGKYYIDTLTGVGTETTLTFDGNWMLYSPTKGSIHSTYDPATITLTDGSTFEYPVIEDVAATPANPEILEVGAYDATKGYGYVVVDVPTKDIEGNDIKESKLYYQLFSDVAGDIQPIVYTAELYANLEEDLTVIPYTFNDSYDFDVNSGYKLVYLNFDFTEYDRIGVKSIYTGGDETHESEIQWFEIEKEEEEVSGDLFNFNAMDVATSSNGSTAGDILEAITLTTKNVTLTVSPKEEGKTTENRFWSTANGPQLRVYSGTLTFEVAEGYEMTEITFYAGKWNEGNTVDSGELGEYADKAITWTGKAQSLVVAIAANTQLDSIAVTVEEMTEELVALPEGVEAQAWTLEGTFTEYFGNNVQSSAEVAFDGEDIYVKGLGYYFEEAWIKGSIADGIATFPSGQFIGNDEDSKIYLLGYDEEEETICDIQFAYDAEAQTLTQLTDYIIVNANSKTEFDANGYWTNAFLYAGEPVIVDPVEAPENLVTETYLFTAKGLEYSEEDEVEEGAEEEDPFVDIAEQVQVGFDGDDLYIQGLSSDCPEFWVKATKNEEGNYIIPANQYMGTWDVGGYGILFYDYYFTAIDEEDNFLDIVLTVDPETGAITTDQLLALNGNKRQLEYYMLFANVAITKIVEVAATPADPTVVAFKVAGETYPKVEFSIPTTSVDGAVLLESNLSYQIFIEKDGEEQPLTLTTDLYTKLEEDMTVIPYTFEDGWDIYKGGERVYLNQDIEEIKSWTKIGVKSIYTAAGETRESNIAWYDLEAYWYAVGINTVAAGDQLVQYFDLQGRAAKASQKGLLIKQVRQQDGSVKTTKVIRK